MPRDVEPCPFKPACVKCVFVIYVFICDFRMSLKPGQGVNIKFRVKFRKLPTEILEMLKPADGNEATMSNEAL